MKIRRQKRQKSSIESLSKPRIGFATRLRRSRGCFDAEAEFTGNSGFHQIGAAEYRWMETALSAVACVERRP
jgi:hypothetical protein